MECHYTERNDGNIASWTHSLCLNLDPRAKRVCVCVLYVFSAMETDVFALVDK